jgi:outer membrane protein TolC
VERPVDPAGPKGAAKERPNVLKELPEKRAGAEDKVNPQPKEQIEGSTEKVEELQKERIATLKELVDQAAGLFKTGRASYEEVLESRMMLPKAELDVAENESERITLYKKTIDALKEYEEWANARVRAAQGTNAAVLKIKARRREVEIQLEQAKIKEAEGGK